MTAWIAHAFFWLTGARDESGAAYGLLSGVGGALPDIMLPAGALGWWWHNQCGVHGCYWYARRTTAAGDRACFRHHPHAKRSVEDLHEAHHAAVKARGNS